MKNEIYHFSIRCYFSETPGDHTTHHVVIPVKDLAKWIECYRFTHPNVMAISIKTWFDNKEVEHELL